MEQTKLQTLLDKMIEVRREFISELKMEIDLIHSQINELRSISGKEIETNLTPSEKEILQHIMNGFSNKEISGITGKSLSTVKSHIRSVFQKMEVRTRSEATTKAYKLGIFNHD
jgi:DNA-binding NarL/FixJ family response regulator